MKFLVVILVAIVASALLGCTNTPAVLPDPPVQEVPQEVEAQVQWEIIPVLSWEKTSTKSERKVWTETLIREIRKEFVKFDKAKGIEKFCPNYRNLSKYHRESFLGELFVGIAYKESGYNPKSEMMEGPPLNHKSIGLYQLSYSSDGHRCGLKESTKDLWNGPKNIACAVKLAARFVGNDGILTDGYQKSNAKGFARYWAVMRYQKNGKPRESYLYIKNKTNQLSICKGN